MPDLPPGFEIESRGDYDPLGPLLSQGIEATNGYRTEGDIHRLKREGYTPASNSDHLRGDAVDLVPGKSGWNLTKLATMAKQQFGPEAQVGIHNGTHVHVSLKGWGQAPGTPGTPRSGLPNLPPGFELEQRGSLKGANYTPTGDVHDGDTLRLDNGKNGRLLGVDAFELSQTGRDPHGQSIPLGQEARDALTPFAGGTATATGGSTYGRPVVSLDNGGDAGQSVIRQGLGLAEPKYLGNDPTRFGQYMEAERLARLNQLGAHGNTYQTPSSFRHGNPDPWAAPQQATDGKGDAVFWDDPTPFQGLRPEIAQGYIALTENPASTADDLMNYAQTNGFTIRQSDADEFIKKRNSGAKPSGDVTYETPPRPLIDPGDGRFGTTLRGFGDPVNLLDEFGGIADTLGATGGRENVFNSERRFGDIYANNVDQNRAILEHDDATHPNYRLGGQLASGLAIPGAGVEGVAAKAFEEAIAAGASEWAAQQIAKKAVTQRLAAVGAAEGGLMGGGGAEGNPLERLPSAAAGAAMGAVAGPVLGKVVEGAGALATNPAVRKTVREMLADESGSLGGRRPDTIDVNGQPNVTPGTAEQRAVAAEVQPEEAIAPLSDVAKAGNINLKNIDTPEDIDALMKFTAHTFGDFNPERRGVQSWEETKKLADDLGMTPDDLLSRRTGEAFNAEQAHAARGILASSAAETRKLADAAISGSEDDKAAFVKSFLLHAAITEKASGAAAEAGRALNIYRKVAQAQIGDRKAIQDAVRRMQGGASPEQIAEMVKSFADDPTALNKFARDAIKPRFRDKLMFVWINSLLSGPKTHVVNMTSNLLTAAMSFPEHALAAGIGKSHSGDKVLLSELGPRFYGMVRGGAEGLSAAREAFAIGEAGGKVDAIRPAIGGTAGRIISIPTRALNAEDVFFKSMARRSELAGLAVRKARSEGLKGEALQSRIDEILANPTDAMIQASNDAALYKTFQRPLGPAGQKLATAIEAWGWPKLFIPFIRTPTNLIKYAAEHSPAAPLLKEVRNDFLAGGARRDLAIARMTMGTGIAASIAGLAANGHITGGGPADPSAKRALEANGWQPYSFKIGDTYISYRRLDPWATVIGMAADSVELQSAMTEKQQQDAGAVMVGAMVKNLSNKTWLSGLSDLVDAITDPQANAKNVLTRLGSSMATPTIAAQTAQAIDPVSRDTNGNGYIDTLRKKIEARIPGASKNLIPRRDIFGNEVRNEANPVARMISPFDVSTGLNDPDAQAVLDSGARFDVPDRGLKGARLPDDMFDTYQSYAGQLSKQYIQAVRTDPEWRTLDKEQKAKAIESAKNQAREDARSALYAQ